MGEYKRFIESKKFSLKASGFSCDNLNPALFDFQRDIVKWALKLGRAAIFANTGMGKTLMQCEWARQVNIHTGKPILILAPLAVAAQTARDMHRFGIDIRMVATQDDCGNLSATNYEKLAHFSPDYFGGIVLDESSILKSFTSKTRDLLIQQFRHTPYKLACTATPSPNDYVELGNHAEFLNVMSRTEMLSMFFVHDGGDTSQWRLKGHAEDKFWEWVASWAAVISKPSDLGYDDSKYNLPELKVIEHIVNSENTGDSLFAMEAQTLEERREARKNSFLDRVKCAADIANKCDGPFLAWCDLNIESEALKKHIDNAVEVKGSDDIEFKETAMLDFAAGKIKCLVTKPSIAGFGMNWQACSNMAFVGLSDSFEQYYQAVRRCWRFGQTKPVTVHIITSVAEGTVLKNIKRKEQDAEKMTAAMVGFTREFVRANIAKNVTMSKDYCPNVDMIFPQWAKGE